MIITNEDYNLLTQAITLLTRICKNVIMSDEEEKHEREIYKLILQDKKAGKFKPALQKPTMQISAIHFSKKEIMQMPEEFQKIITVNLTLNVRKKPNGVYEARFRKNGYNISVSSTKFNNLKPKFLEALKHYRTEPAKTALHPATMQPLTGTELFSNVAKRWLELKRSEIKERTYKYYVTVFGANILPVLLGRKLNTIRQSELQALINSYIDQGKYRTATKIYQTLKAVFDFAVGEELIEKSPMRLIKPPKYEEKNGCALTLNEERQFIELLNASKCDPDIKNALLLLLYTGIRRSELASAQIKDGFTSVICAKTRKGFQERRRLIPITPMLKQWLPQMNVARLNNVRPDALTQAMKRLMPVHHLHELRHTFITRCQECGVSREVVSVWAGHAADNTQTSNVYTHFSAEFMQREAQKVIYNL